MEEENDITIEESTEEGEVLSGSSKIKKLQERIKELELKIVGAGGRAAVVVELTLVGELRRLREQTVVAESWH